VSRRQKTQRAKRKAAIAEALRVLKSNKPLPAAEWFRLAIIFEGQEPIKRPAWLRVP